MEIQEDEGSDSEVEDRQFRKQRAALDTLVPGTSSSPSLPLFKKTCSKYLSNLKYERLLSLKGIGTALFLWAVRSQCHVEKIQYFQGAN